ALEKAQEAKEAGKPLSVGFVGNAPEVYNEILKRDFKIDIITDQTSAHDPLNGYVPEGYSLEEASALRDANPEEYVKLSSQSMKNHVAAMLEF
ncbi:urocanate hydratase, partial [Klebsiella pneumoniae]|nr:urocanate hydratase [Klebsiella pneumoniae]